MPDDQDDSQKTEEPTHKRLEDAKKKGQVPFSREITSFLMLLILAVTVIWLSPSIMRETTLRFTPFIELAHQFRLDSVSSIELLKDVFFDFMSLMFLIFIVLIFAILASSFLQNGIIIASDPIMPKLEKISVLKGLKRLFSLKSFVEFIKGVIKISIIAFVSFLAVYPHIVNVDQYINYEIIGLMLVLLEIATTMLIGITAIMLIIAAMDFIYQKFEHTKSLRMSKQDLKDEFKQTEGSPEVKAKLREIRNQRASQRMMQALPKADVVITNPTHYSVALKYDQVENDAPVLVAKGKDLIALKIREIAKEHGIPIVENPPLARSLFNSVELEQEIPLEHYNAVAEVIRYIYSLKKKK